jgi:hypothetical protein
MAYRQAEKIVIQLYEIKQFKQDLLSFGMLHSVDWQLVT